jgi:hypothetical protein
LSINKNHLGKGGIVRRMNLALVGAALIWTGLFASDAGASQGYFPTTLSDNTTGHVSTPFVGAPNDSWWGLGSTSVTYDFGTWRVTNGIGQDLNVYEADRDTPESTAIKVLVSANGINFFDITSTHGALVRIGGDSSHAGGAYATSYDLGPSGLSEVRYVKIQGIDLTDTQYLATHPQIGTGFDLDAIGAINYRNTAVPLPSALLLLGSGLTGLGFIKKRIRPKHFKIL